MTVFSTLLLLLLIVSPSIADEAVRVNCISQVNVRRRQIARDKNIANMNELSYDTALETEIITIRKDFTSDYCNKGRYETHPNYDIGVGDLKTFADESLAGEPTRTKFACIKDDCDPNQELYDFIADKPQRLNDDNVVINGPPGSKCPPGRESDSDLCALHSAAERPEGKSAVHQKTEKPIVQQNMDAESSARPSIIPTTTTEASGTVHFSTIISSVILIVFWVFY